MDKERKSFMDDADSDEEAHLYLLQLISDFICFYITGMTCGLFGRRVVSFSFPEEIGGGANGQIR